MLSLKHSGSTMSACDGKYVYINHSHVVSTDTIGSFGWNLILLKKFILHIHIQNVKGFFYFGSIT